jgi:hypothetical protein
VSQSIKMDWYNFSFDSNFYGDDPYFLSLFHEEPGRYASESNANK